MEFASLSSDGTVESTAVVAPEARYGPAFDAWSSERSAGIRSGSAISPKGALTLAAYYAAINVLSTDLACLPKKIYRKRRSGRGRDEVTDDPRSEFLEVSPDEETTAMRQWQALLGHTFGWGNGYAELGFSGGAMDGVYLLDPTTEPSRRSQDKKLYYRLPDGSTRPPYKMLHLAGFGYDGLCGYSPARLMQQTIRLGKNAETFGANFFDNGITASGHFEAPHRYDKDAADAFRAEMNAMHAGAGNAHRFMVLWNGWKWTKTTIPPNEAQFLESRAFQVLEVARMFRLPPHKLGDYSQSHLANIEESNIDYMTTVLMPWCKSIEQELNRKLFTREERVRGYYIKHNMEAFLRGNSASRLAWYQGMFGLSVYDIDEIREYEDLNPIGQFGDERFLTVQAQPLSTLLNPPAPPKAPAGASGQPAENEPAPVPAVNGQRFKPVPNGVAALVHGGDGRFNPNHGADGKFSGGGGHFAGIAPAATTTGSKIVVEEVEPKSTADKKQLAAAEKKDQTAIHIKDTPDIEAKRSESGTITKVGDYTASTITRAPDGSGWKFHEHGYDGKPLGEGDTKTFRSRERAEQHARKDAKVHQEYHSRQHRLNTKDPDRVVREGYSAHEYDYGRKVYSGPLSGGGKWRLEPGTEHDKSNAKWTTTYRILKKPEA